MHGNTNWFLLFRPKPPQSGLDQQFVAMALCLYLQIEYSKISGTFMMKYSLIISKTY